MTPEQRDTMLKLSTDTLVDMVNDLGNRVEGLEDLLRSAHAIAKREGKDTNWERFGIGIGLLGIGSITARTYKVLPSDNPRCVICGAKESTHGTDHLCRMHRDESGRCTVCGSVQPMSLEKQLEQQLKYKERLAIKDDALTASMMIAEFTAAANVKLAEAVLEAHDNDGRYALCQCEACKLAREIVK